MASRFSDLANILLPPTATLRQVLESINQNIKGIVLIVNDSNQLLDSITDGDVRRAILAGRNLDEPVSTISQRPERMSRPRPVSVGPETTTAEVLALMKSEVVQQIPIVDDEHHVIGLHVMSELVPSLDGDIEAIVMAGGFGVRLRPLTSDTPKPMLPVGDRPLLEHIIAHLKGCGVTDVRVTTHFMPEIIQQHFGDGKRFGVNIDYVNEDEPLGTAGALRLIERPTRTMLVMNGDILTNVDFRKLKRFHDESQAALTVAVRLHDTVIPFGVVNESNGVVTGIVEKPTLRHLVNAGIYLIEPRATEYLGSSGRLDMTDLIERLIANNEKVASFPLAEYWLDIGQKEDYIQAQDDILSGRV